MNKYDYNFDAEPTPENELYFDDQAVETMIYNMQPVQNPSPVNIVSQWADGHNVTKEMESIIIKMLIQNYELAIEEHRAKKACLLLNTALTEAEDLPLEKSKLLIALWQLSRKFSPDESKEYYRRAKELTERYGSDSDKLTFRFWNTSFDNESGGLNFYALRSKALDKLVMGDFAEAEKIYLELIPNPAGIT